MRSAEGAVERRTICRLCAATCGMIVTVDGDRIVDVRGDRHASRVAGVFVPERAARWVRSITTRHRLDHPVLRGERVDWPPCSTTSVRTTADCSPTMVPTASATTARQVSTRTRPAHSPSVVSSASSARSSATPRHRSTSSPRSKPPNWSPVSPPTSSRCGSRRTRLGSRSSSARTLSSRTAI